MEIKVNPFAEIAGRPGARCAECRFFAFDYPADRVFGGIGKCQLVPPTPARPVRPATEGRLFCPAWEPTVLPKAGCLLDVPSFDFGKWGKSFPARITVPGPDPVDELVLPISTPTEKALANFTVGLRSVRAHLWRAPDCPCRTAKVPS